MKMRIYVLMRLSLWMLFGAASLFAIFWLMLVVASGFDIWLNDSNMAGLLLQSGLILSPLCLLFGLKQANGHFYRTLLAFGLSWIVAIAALVFFNVL